MASSRVASRAGVGCTVRRPDRTAASLIGNVAGTHKSTLTVLITPEEVDQATGVAKEKMAAYRPPGR